MLQPTGAESKLSRFGSLYRRLRNYLKTTPWLVIASAAKQSATTEIERAPKREESRLGTQIASLLHSSQ